MITVSLCMIVKNEERVLARCLDSIKGLVDEIIIADTGSTDKTREIAAAYTDKVYDFAWTGDFSEARNFVFSKASCEYIYSADADEVVDPENAERFLLLKEALLPEIEIVQMYYGNQLSFGTIYNYDRELRPKLFKRLRSFVWEGPIHETVRLAPVVFDSEIEIIHLPEKSHAGRDLAAFRRQVREGKPLSGRLRTIYAKELFISGEREDFLAAEDYFTELADSEELKEGELKEALCVAVKAAGLRRDFLKLYRYALKDIASDGVSEVCCELGEYYYSKGEYKEAALWFYNAAYETHSILDIRYSGEIPLERLVLCYEKLGMPEQAEFYKEAAQKWKEEQKQESEAGRN